MNEAKSEAHDLGHKVFDTLWGLAPFLIRYVVLMFVAVFTDPIIFSMFVGAVAVGFATNALVGVATFFILYTVARVVGNVADSIGFAGHSMTNAAIQHVNGIGMVFRPAPEPTFQPVQEDVPPVGIGMLPRS